MGPAPLAVVRSHADATSNRWGYTWQLGHPVEPGHLWFIVDSPNALGLTTQMPVQQTFLTRTRSQKRYVFGKQQVTIRPAAAWNFLLPDRPAGQAIRALTWLGPDQAGAALPTLRTVLLPEEWEALLSVSAELPLWLATLLNNLPQKD